MLPWIVALAAAALAVVLAGLLLLARRAPRPKPLPTEWALTPRPVFSAEERRVYRQLREALPHHIVLSKLPLVRFCQPDDPEEVRYWYELLGSTHVTFAVCSANGRVLAAVDLHNDRANSRRVLQIKQAVLAACRVRYLRCPADHLPSIPELQLLVPSGANATRGPQPAPSVRPAREPSGEIAGTRRRERAPLWQDSTAFQDSFFSPDLRQDAGGPGSAGFGPSTMPSTPAQPVPGESPDDIVGIVVDSPRTPPAGRA